MEILGLSRIASRGQTTVGADIRQRVAIEEGHFLEWAYMQASEFSQFPPDKVFLVVTPKRLEPIPLRFEHELDDAFQQAKEGTALSISDLVDQTIPKA